MVMLKQAVIGIDIGGTKIAAHISDGTLWRTAAQTSATPPESQPGALTGLVPGTPAYQQALRQGRAALLDMLEQISLDLLASAEAAQVRIAAIGVGSAGQIDPARGVVVDANENLVGWKGTTVAAHLSAALSLPVYVENDVRAMTLAETTLGAGRGYRHVLGITVGTGIGGALVLNGQLWHGAHHSAGEIGYLQAAPGQSIEDLYAGPAIAHHFMHLHQLSQPLSLIEMAQRAQAGDLLCAAAIEGAATGLGEAIAPAFGLIDPEAIIVGGGVPEIGALWWQPFIAAIRACRMQSVRQMPILRAELGADAGCIGASRLAAQQEGLV